MVVQLNTVITVGVPIIDYNTTKPRSTARAAGNGGGAYSGASEPLGLSTRGQSKNMTQPLTQTPCRPANTVPFGYAPLLVHTDRGCLLLMGQYQPGRATLDEKRKKCTVT